MDQKEAFLVSFLFENISACKRGERVLCGISCIRGVLFSKFGS
jgi:hypothetical protein